MDAPVFAPIENKETEEIEKMPRKKLMRWVFLLVGLGPATLLVYGVWRYLERPAVGEIWTSTVVSREDRDSKNERKEYRGEYLVFSHPISYEEKTYTLPVKGPVKESILLSEKSVEGKKIAIVVEERSGGDYTASPAFQMRSLKPKDYEKAEDMSLGGYRGVLFRKDTGVFERTFFLHDSDLVVTVSMSSPFSAEALEGELSNIIKSIRFLKSVF